MQLDHLETLSYMYVAIMHHPVTVSLNTCSLTHVQIKHSLAHLQDTLAGVISYISYTSQSRY